MALDPSIKAHYDLGIERPRLAEQSPLEWVRSRELLERFLPRAPATILDVGGGPGVYASWLAAKGYTVRLIDPVPRHVDEARALAAHSFEAEIRDARHLEAAERSFEAELGDARRLEAGDASYDAVLLMGPLYHLVERSDRLLALREAARVVRVGGKVIVVAISRFASLLDGLRFDWLHDPDFRSIVDEDLRSGQHRNPRPEQRPEWFTTAFFHRPDELVDEVAESGLSIEAVLGIEGPGWLVRREVDQSDLVDVARKVESEPSLLGASAHLMLIARRLAT